MNRFLAWFNLITSNEIFSLPLSDCSRMLLLKKKKKKIWIFRASRLMIFDKWPKVVYTSGVCVCVCVYREAQGQF